MDGEPTHPAGPRRARVALLVAGAVVLLATAGGVGVALGAAGGHDRQPGAAAGVAAPGTTVAGQDPGASVTAGAGGGGGGSVDPATTGAGTSGGKGGASGGGTGKGGPPRTTTGRPTTTQATGTTLPQIVIQETNWAASESCSQGSDGAWHYVVQFHVTVDSIGTGTVRYQWGRGADDARSEIKTYDIPVQYAFVTSHVRLSDTVKGNAASPTETVVDRLHVLAPPDLDGQPFTATMVHTVCP
jgi:hypothetical protein